MEKAIVIILLLALVIVGYVAFTGGFGDGDPVSEPPREDSRESRRAPESASPATAPVADPLARFREDRSDPVGLAGAPDQISGTVRTATGAPVAGATVQIVTYQFIRGKLPPDFEEIIDATRETDASGRYEFRGLEVATPPRRLVLRCLATGYITQIKDQVAVGMFADFTLKPGAALRGRILDADTGKAVPKAKIKGYYRTDPAVTNVSQIFRWTELAWSGDDGKYRFEGAPLLRIMLMVTADGYEETFEEGIEIRPGIVNEKDIRVRRGLVIRGVVLDRMTDKPVPRARITLSEFGIFPKAQTECNEKGEFELRGVKRSKVALSAAARGYGEGREVRDLGEADEKEPLRIWVEPCGRATGRVVDAGGRPVAGAELFAADKSALFYKVRGQMGQGGKPVADAVADRDGFFVVEDLAPGLTWRLAAAHADWVVGISEDFQVRPGEVHADVTIALRAPARIEGRVVDDAGGPVAGAVVAVESPPFADVWFPPGFKWGQMGVRTFPTDESGNFIAGSLYAGTYTVSVDHPEHVPIARQTVLIRDPGEVVQKEFTLALGRTISGQVIFADGSPAVGAKVAACTEFRTEPEAEAVAGADGRYTVQRLGRGQYRVKARSADGRKSAPVRENVNEDTSGVDFVLAGHGTLAGTVLRQGGDPGDLFTVALTGFVDGMSPQNPQDRKKAAVRGLEISRGFSTPDGRFNFDNIEPGRYSLRITSEEEVPTELPEIEIRSDEVTDVGVITMTRGGSIEGVVADSGGRPLRNVFVQAVSLHQTGQGETDRGKMAGGGDTRNARSIEDGSYRIPGLKPGPWSIRVESTDHVTPPPETLTVSPSGAIRKDFLLARSANVTFYVVDDAGQPVAGVMTLLYDETGKRYSPQRGISPSDARGMVKLVQIAPGNYRVQIQRSGYIVQEYPLGVAEGTDVPEGPTFTLPVIR